MGATVFMGKIYVSKDLDEKITDRERKVLFAHEIAHYKHKDLWIKLFCLVVDPFRLWLYNRASRALEIRADRYAIKKTGDKEAFKTLMEKLRHNPDRKDYPTREERLALAHEKCHRRYSLVGYVLMRISQLRLDLKTAQRYQDVSSLFNVFTNDLVREISKEREYHDSSN